MKSSLKNLLFQIQVLGGEKNLGHGTLRYLFTTRMLVVKIEGSSSARGDVCKRSTGLNFTHSASNQAL